MLGDHHVKVCLNIGLSIETWLVFFLRAQSRHREFQISSISAFVQLLRVDQHTGREPILRSLGSRPWGQGTYIFYDGPVKEMDIKLE